MKTLATLACALAVLLPCAAGRADQPTPDERKALQQLASEIEGTIVYTRYTGSAVSGGGAKGDARNWVVEKITVGQLKPVQLGMGRFACWSPDCKQIAVFVFDEPSGASNKSTLCAGKLFVMDADGNGRRQIADHVGSKVTGRPMYWHPNGKEIVYMKLGTATGSGEPPCSVYAVNVATGEIRDFLPNMKDKRGNYANFFSSEPQLSADGKFLAARCSTSSGGKGGPVLVDMEKQVIVLNSQGTCCASVSPDGNWLTGNFSGHDRVVIEHRDGKQVILADSKGMAAPDRATNSRTRVEKDWDNPTWSNHPDYLACKADNGSGSVYVFRVSLKRWTRVSFDQGQCDYPHLLVTKDLLANRKPLTGDGAAQSDPVAQTRPAAWPGDPAGLEFVWADGARNNAITGLDGKTRACEVQMRGRARLNHDHAMDLAAGAFRTEGFDSTLLAACRASGELTVEAIIRPDSADAKAGGNIITFGGSKQVNFAIRQTGASLACRLTTSAQRAGAEVPLCRLGADKPHHVVATYAAGKISCYLDGTQVASTTSVTGDFRNWSDANLIFGNDANGASPWSGRLEGVAVRSRALTPQGAAAAHDLAAARIKSRQSVQQAVVEATLTAVSVAPEPATLEYRRCLLVYAYDVTKVNQGHVPDKHILVAHWGVLDGTVIPEIAGRKVGSSYTLLLERFDDNPQISSEKQQSDVPDATLPLYFDAAK